MKTLAMSILLLSISVLCDQEAQAQWKKTNWPTTTLSHPGIRRPNVFFGKGTGVPAAFASVSADTDTVFTRSTVFALASNAGSVYAGTYGNGVYVSSDNGGSWKQINTGLNDAYVHALAFSGSMLLAGTDAGVYLSSDNGASWSQETDGLASQVVYAFASIGATLFASTSTGGVFLSADNGVTWTPAGLGPTDVPALAVSGTTLFAGTYGDGIFFSTDNGTTWTAADSGLTTYNRVQALTVSGTTIFAGTRDGGVFRTISGDTVWAQADSGLSTPNVYALATSTPYLFAGTYEGGAFVSQDGGSSWKPMNTGIPQSIVFAFAVNGSELYAGLYGNGVWQASISALGKTTQVASHLPPATIQLEQNYPNPFNPSTTIRYGLGKRSLVSLKIYTMLGQEVATLGAGEQEAGFHEVRFDGSRLASGTYIYRLRAVPNDGSRGAAYVESKKLLLVR